MIVDIYCPVDEDCCGIWEMELGGNPREGVECSLYRSLCPHDDQGMSPQEWDKVVDLAIETATYRSER